MSIIESCIKDIFSWLLANKLSANPNEAVYLLFNTRNINPLVININIDSGIISVSYSTKNLSVLFQSDMSLDNLISSIINSCFVQLLDFRCIRPLISKPAVITLANSFIHSCLDYCNSVFYCLPNNSIYRVQKVQNTAAHILTRSIRSTHITLILNFLHWLPVNYCINSITHCTLSFHEPHYLSSLFRFRSNSHTSFILF